MAIPISQAMTLIKSASMRNCVRISLRNAPSALRIPISRVRSVTDTSMIFMTPIPPTMSEIAATHPRKSVSVPVTEDIDESTSESVLRVNGSVAVVVFV